MKVTVISYSLTGNNDALATSIAAELGAQHIKITEAKTRTVSTIIFDIVFNRTPHVNTIPEVDTNDLVIFMGPVWLGHVATPLRAYFKQLKSNLGNYAFISISGGADGANPKLAGELKKRVGKDPAVLIDMHTADLLNSGSKPDQKATSDYRLNERDVKSLTTKIVNTLLETIK